MPNVKWQKGRFGSLLIGFAVRNIAVQKYFLCLYYFFYIKYLLCDLCLQFFKILIICLVRS